LTDREKAKREYLGGKSLKQIAEETGIKYATLRQWKTRNAWPTVVTKKRHSKKKCDNVTESGPEKPTIQGGLNDKQQLFCELYAKNFNATQSYMTVYGVDYNTANAAGPRLLVNGSVRAYIQSLKEIKRQAIMADQTDILEMYMKIAFANIGDYVTFGRRNIQVMTAFGPLYEKDPEDETIKTPVMKTVNYVDIKESAAVDAGVIEEVTQGKDGVKVKLADRMKALEWLGKYFMMNPMDEHKVSYDEAKQELDRLEYERKKKADEEW
jgi:phage terminase small subunit